MGHARHVAYGEGMLTAIRTQVMSSTLHSGVPYEQPGQGKQVCLYNWHRAGFRGWPFTLLKYKYIFQIKYTEAIVSNSARKLLWFEIRKMLIAVLNDKFIVLFIIIFGILSFPMPESQSRKRK